MTSKLNRERLQEIPEDGFLKHGESKELACLALAAMDSEPVAWTWHYREQWHVTNDERRAELVAKDGDVAVLPLYHHAQTASEREQVRRQHAEWSQATFGNVGPVGPLKHLSKEALEAAEQPGDLSEWADMQFLLWDAQRRAGITDDQITQAMIDKLAVNKQREWPEPKDGEPRLHIKSQPAPVITFYRDGIEAAAKWIDQQREVYDSEHGWSDPDTGVLEFGNDAQREYSSTLEELAEGIRALHPNAGNSQVIGIDLAIGADRTVEVRYVAPPGYVMVPMRLTYENGAKGALSGEFSETKFVNCPECFSDDECETCDGSGRIEITVPVTWTTIKAIWVKGVEHFATTAQENN